MNLQSKNALMIILVITIVVDIMGAGLVFPIMPSLFFNDVYVTFGNPSSNFQNWYYAMALACWPLGLMIGCPIIGELSDKYGRRSIIVVALLATASSYVLSAYAIYTNSYLLFIASRFISGLSGGAFEIAQAAVIDISTVKNKARNLGYITMAASLGFVAGPVITSAMSSLHISHTMPFLFAGVMALVNITFIMIFMRKDLPKNPGLIVDFKSVYRAILFLITDKRVRIIGVIYLLVQCGWGFYAQGVALFLHTMYGYGITETGLFYAAMGFATAFASLTIQPRIFAKVSKTKALVVSALICGFGLVVVNIVGHEFMQWILSIVLSASQLICYTALLYIISTSVSDKEQGKAMGAAGAGFGLAWFINDIAMGHLSSITAGTPITVGGLFYFVAVAIFIIAVKIFRERVQ